MAKKETNIERIRQFARANNNLGSRNIFDQRLAYSAFAYENLREEIKPAIKDFNRDEFILYGRVDKNYRAVTVKQSSLLAIPNTDNQFALPFVADAASEFIKEVRIALDKQKLSRFPFFRNLEIVRSYVPYDYVQIDMLNRAFDAFLYSQRAFNKAKDILNIDIFIQRFVDFLMEYAQENPLSSQAFITSRFYDMSCSGLCIDFLEEDFSNDAVKMAFIDSVYFDYYVTLAAKYGFYVDKNMPTRLVSNLSSSVTKKFILASGQTNSSSRSVFTKNYNTAYRKDIEIFRNFMFISYRRYATTRPTVKETLIQDGNLFTRYHQREFELVAQYEKKYTNEFWTDFYVKLRNVESQLDFSMNQVRTITNNAIEIEKSIDRLASLNYINRVFMDIPIKEGSSYDRIYRNYLRGKTEMPFENYPEYLKEAYKTR